ncbi:MAG: hypothetical protein R6V49_03430 [Bacteroidales bacterium]
MAKRANIGANHALNQHIQEVIAGQRRFENVFQSVSRMILDGKGKISKVNVNGRNTYDFSVFREGKKHIIGMFDEINSFVSFVKDAAEGGSSAEMAFVLIISPWNIQEDVGNIVLKEEETIAVMIVAVLLDME